MLCQWVLTCKTYATTTAVTYLEGGITKTLTYGQLDALSNQLAGELPAALCDTTPVAVFALPHHPAWIVAILAIWKRGGSVLLLNHDLHPATLIERIRNARCAGVILCDTTSAPLANDYFTKAFLAERYFSLSETQGFIINYHEAIRSGHTSSVPLREATPDSQLAYITYTSGSTDKPKAIAINHAGIKNLTESHFDVFAKPGHDIVLQSGNLNFDPCWMELFLLCYGVRYVLCDYSEITPDRLANYSKEQAVTAVIWVPSFMAKLNPHDFSKSLTVLTTGESCSEVLLAKWANCIRRITIGYGPSESTVGCSLGLYQEKLHLGLPVKGMSLHLLKYQPDNGAEPWVVIKPEAIGQKGQLALSGPGLARGYLLDGECRSELPVIRDDSQEELEPQNKFFNYTLEGKAIRLFLTGDYAEYTAENTLHLEGRRDRQIKLLGGKRIELLAIEQAVSKALKLPNVKIIPHCVPNQEQKSYDYLCAFILGIEKLPFAPENLIKILNQECPNLPDVPRRWFMVNKPFDFTKPSNNKFDYKALSDCFHATEGEDPAFTNLSAIIAKEPLTAETTPTLTTDIVGIIRRIVDPICRDTEIPEAYYEDLAGSSSITWMALMEALEKKFEINLQARAQLQLNFNIKELIDDIALQSVFKRAWSHKADQAEHDVKLFCCPPVTGSPAHFHQIKNWKLNVKLHALTMPPLLESTPALDHYKNAKLFLDLEKLAEYAFLAMRRHQGSGPYFICGYSWGSIFAYAIAHHLQQRGFELGWLGILDGAYPGVLDGLRGNNRLLDEIYQQVFTFIAKVSYQIELPAHYKPSIHPTEKPRGKLEKLFTWIFQELEQLRLSSPEARLKNLRDCEILFESITFNIYAALKYIPSQTLKLANQGNVTLFHTEHDNASTCMSAFIPGWQTRFLSPLPESDIQYLKGVKHIALLRDPSLGEKISEAITPRLPTQGARWNSHPFLVKLTQLQLHHWQLPETNRRYVLRPALDNALVTALSPDGHHPSRTVFLDGFGGSGKSQSLIHLIKQVIAPHAPHYTVIIYFTFSTLNDFHRQLVSLLKERLPTESPDNISLNSAMTLFYKNYLGSLKGRKLVVIDNVHSNTELHDFLGMELRDTLQIDMLIASRDGNIPDHCIALHMADYPFLRNQGIGILNYYDHTRTWNDEDKYRLCHRLSDYPLAIDMAAAFCNQSKPAMGCHQYLENLDELFQQYLSDEIKTTLGLSRQYHETLLSVVSSTLKLIEAHPQPMLRPLLLMITIGDSSGSGLLTLRHLMQAYFIKEAYSDKALAFHVDNALRILESLNVIQYRTSNPTKAAHIHPLVAESIVRLSENTLRTVINCINHALNYPSFNPAVSETLSLYHEEGLGFACHYIMACLQLKTTFKAGLLDIIISLLGYLHITNMQGPRLDALTNALFDKLKLTRSENSGNDSLTQRLSVILQLLGRYFHLFNKEKAYEIYEELMAWDMPGAQKNSMQLNYLMLLCRTAARNDPRVITLITDLNSSLEASDRSRLVLIHSIGELYVNNGYYLEAVPFYEKVASEFERFTDPKFPASKINSYELSVALDGLCKCHIKLGFIAKAIQANQRSLHFKKVYYQNNKTTDLLVAISSHVANLIFCDQPKAAFDLLDATETPCLSYPAALCHLQYLLGDYTETLRHYKKLVDQPFTRPESTTDKACYDNNAELSVARLDTARIYFARGQYHRAIALLSTFPSDNDSIRLDTLAIARSYLVCTQLQAGLLLENPIEHVLETIAYAEKAFHNKNNLMSAMLYYNLALFLRKQNFPLDSFRTYNLKAISIYKTLCEDAPYPSLGLCYLLQAHIRLILVKNGTAKSDVQVLKAIEEAETIFKNAYGDRVHPDKIEAGLMRVNLLIHKAHFTQAASLLTSLYEQNLRLAIPNERLTEEIFEAIRRLPNKKLKITFFNHIPGPVPQAGWEPTVIATHSPPLEFHTESRVHHGAGLLFSPRFMT